MKNRLGENFKYIIIPAAITLVLSCLAAGLLFGGFAHFLLGS